VDLERHRQGAGAWNLDADANESQKGFLLNHLISEELPAGGTHFQLRPDHRPGGLVRRARAHLESRPAPTSRRDWPQFEPMKPYPGMKPRQQRLAGLGRNGLGKRKGSR
jgi:hypothetical protein